MALINDINDFKTLTSNITSFSHAYLLNVNDLEKGYACAKELAKSIVFAGRTSVDNNIIHQIDSNEFDDLYVVNPSTVSINSQEITNLLNYMETKSLREDGKRIYIIYGYERISREVGNKILKFLEEPQENIYGIILTADINKVLPTIISRCQIMPLSFAKVEVEHNDIIELMKLYLENILKNKRKMLAYNNDYFADVMQDREKFYQLFDVLEQVISNNLKAKNDLEIEELYLSKSLQQISEDKLVTMLKITNKLKSLIKRNINLCLLLDRYIIEVVRELSL